MRIAVDALGGDHAPSEIVAGAIAAVREKKGLQLALVGPEDKLRVALRQEGMSSAIGIVPAADTIGNDEAPVIALRRKPNSTLAVGARLIKDGQADAFVTAGNTGAFMAAGLLIAGRIAHVERPALAPLLPTVKGNGVVLLDVGATMDAKAENLAQYGLMGSIYAERVLGKVRPRVALLNVGSEEGKGNQVSKDAFSLLAASSINFVGNMEARTLLSGEFDVVVCDGFTGNVLLKMMEGVTGTMFELLREAFLADYRGKLGALLLKPSLRQLKRRFDYAEHGGAPLLGINGVFVKCHGSSRALAIKKGIFQAEKFITQEVIKKITGLAEK